MSRVLGGLDGFVNVGEGFYLFNIRRRQRKVPCGCGQTVEECSFWRGVAGTLPDESVQWLTRRVRGRYFFYLWVARACGRIPTAWRQAVSTVEEVYSEVAARSDARVIVDSSKNPSYGLVLSMSDRFSFYMLHLVRDARAVLASWGAPKGWLRRKSAPRASVTWLWRNVCAELASAGRGRYFRLRWEDFVLEPQACLRDVLTFLGEDPRAVERGCKGNGKEFWVGLQHDLGGNPAKLEQTERVRLEPGASRAGGPMSSSAWLCLPLLWRYGYRGPSGGFR